MTEEGKTKYDWVALKQKFFESDILDARVFIKRELGLPNEELLSGNIQRNILGWGEEKKEYKRKIAEEAKKELFEKLKVEVRDLLLTKKLAYQLIGSKIEIYAKILAGKELTQQERDFMAIFSIPIDTIIKWVQIELGLPTSIAELQGTKEKPVNILALVREADEILKEEEKRRNTDTGSVSK